MPGQVDVPTKAGDALIWDLRLFHRASPNVTGGNALPGGKIALFYTLGKDNRASRTFLDYWRLTQNRKSVELPPPTEYCVFV